MALVLLYNAGFPCTYLQSTRLSEMLGKDVFVNFVVQGIIALLILLVYIVFAKVVYPITRKRTVPLHYAAENGQKDMVQRLIANEYDVNTRDKDGLTPLHEAAKKGDKEIAELLLMKGADVNAKNKNGSTPLYWAVTFGKNADLIELLRRHGGKK